MDNNIFETTYGKSTMTPEQRANVLAWEIEREKKKKKEDTGKAIAGCIGTMMGLVILFAAQTAIVFYVWNLVVSPYFHIAPLTWWLAALLALFLSGFQAKAASKGK